MMLDRDMKVKWANNVLARGFGLTPDEMIGRLWYDPAPPTEFLGEKAADVLPDEVADQCMHSVILMRRSLYNLQP